MKRFFNLRYTVLFSVAFALGAVACLAFYNRLVAPSVVFLSLPVVIGVVVGIVQKNNRFKVAVVSMVCLMLVLAGFLSFNWRVESSFPSNASGDAIVSARFTSKDSSALFSSTIVERPKPSKRQNSDIPLNWT